MRFFTLIFFHLLCVLSFAQSQIVTNTQSFTLKKNQLKGNEITFQIENTQDQPFVAFDIKINGKLKNDANVSMLVIKMPDDISPLLDIEKNESSTKAKQLKHDIHFANENSWSSELQFLPINTKTITIEIKNSGNKIEDINFNFFYPNKTENIKKVNKNKAAAPAPPISCACPIPAYQSRADWDTAGIYPAQTSPTFTSVSHLVVHHSAGPNTSSDWAATVRSIWNYHVNSNHWADIGYNYLIDPNGIIYEGRGNNIQGAHAAGFNSNSMGVCLLGNYQPTVSEDVDPTLAMKNSLVEILSWKECDISADPLLSSLHVPTGQVKMNISGHRDVGTTITSCPGDKVYELLPNFRNSCSSFMSTCSFTSNPDLVVSALATNPSAVVAGNPVALNVAVGNGGSADVFETINVVLKIDGSTVQTFQIDTILAGQILNFSEANYIFDSIKNYQLCVYLGTATNETNTANNSYCKTISVTDSVVLNSDLIVKSITSDIGAPTVSESVTFNFDLKNAGVAATSEAVEGKIIIDGQIKQLFTVPILSANQSHLQNFTYSFSQAGSHNVCVDMKSPTNEINSANNSYCKTYNVSAVNVGIKALDENILSLKLFPNPAGQVLNIAIEFKENETIDLALVNALGQIVFSKNIINQSQTLQTIDVSTLASGMYFFQIKTANQFLTRKVILE